MRNLNTLIDSNANGNTGVGKAALAEMATYRQALRDLPANTADVSNPVYPVHPNEL